MEKQISKALGDSIVFGTGIVKTGIRKWYNPMRWIKGPIYHKRIKPSDFYR